MRKLAILLVLCFGAIVTGCGMVDSYGDRERRCHHVCNYMGRQLVDDWDYFWLCDRPPYLTYWYFRDFE